MKYSTSNYVDEQRQSRNFLSRDELVRTVGRDNSILDDASVLISSDVTVGVRNVFYPNVIIERQGDGRIIIGDGNVFYPGVYVICSAGSVKVGDSNDFGPAGVTVKSNMADALIQIGDNGRYCGGVSMMGKTQLGSGSQILGNITIQNCTLAGGGTYHEPSPDLRAAVLKGFGLARGITLEAGQVVSGVGNFSEAPVEWQRAYHPKSTAI